MSDARQSSTAAQAPPQPLSIPSNLLSRPSQTLTDLATQSRLLHLLHHRSRNQHRRSTWYRHFNAFRRQTRQLCVELGHDPLAVEPAPTAVGKRAGSRREPVKATKKLVRDKAKAVQRLTWWVHGGLVERWYAAFTTLAATPSFAPLSLVLVAILARVAALTGVSAYLKAEGIAQDAEMRAAGEMSLSGKDVAVAGLGHGTGVEDDIGVVVSREDVLHAVGNSENDAGGGLKVSSADVERPTRSKVVEKRAGKRRSTNAIDDLFDGLG